MDSNEQIANLCELQFAAWPELRKAYDFRNVERKTFQMGDLPVMVQCNPARIVSTGAKIDKKSIAERKCPLCDENRPQQQLSIPLPQSGYKLLINPFPILPVHFTIVSPHHEPQKFNMPTVVEVLQECPTLTVFYNGSRAGASSPDHAHLQAVLASELPLLRIVEQRHKDGFEACSEDLGDFPMSFISLMATADELSLSKLTQRLEETYGLENDAKPDSGFVNIFVWLDDAEHLRALIFPRRKHRPDCYFTEDDKKMLVSPGALDMAGIMVTPRKEDFDRIAETDIRQIYNEVSCRNTATVTVAITPDAFVEMESTPEGTLLKGQPLGEGFHWQTRGEIVLPGRVTAENLPDGKTRVTAEIGLEEYIAGVVASEMNADAPLELLKAHAVIARTWLMHKRLHLSKATLPSEVVDGKIITWEDGAELAHPYAEVCNQDHCQRYYGASVVTEKARQAAFETAGEFLADDLGNPIDARYSKCCGGHTERFSACWADEDFDYFRLKEDDFCNPATYTNQDVNALLRPALNNIDHQTTDWFSWTEIVPKSLVAKRLKELLNMDLGDIRSVAPMQRGESGRIFEMKIEGEKGSLVVGKELLIRRLLSETTLKSSWFEIEDQGNVFLLKGRGWGHGVGLCQIGAALMATQGYGYRQILDHYYNARLKK